MKKLIGFAASAAFLFVLQSGHMVTATLEKGVLEDGTTYPAYADKYALPLDEASSYGDPAIRESVRQIRAELWKNTWRLAQRSLYGKVTF